jgi:hypothetical protein
LNIQKDDYVVIERQTQNNTVAMELMYALTSLALFFTDNIIIFDPKLKFTAINEEYNTKNLQHKKKSVSMASSFLADYPQALEIFNRLEKKDDVSDALNQGLIQLALMKKIDMCELKNKFHH